MNQILEEIALFVFAYLFQSILYVTSIHLFSNHPLKWKPFILCAFIVMVLTYLARVLLTFGVHTLFSLIFLILLSIGLLKIPAQKVVKSALLIAILTFIYEGTIFFAFSAFMGIEGSKNFVDTNSGKILTGFISNILLTVTLIPVYIYKKSRNARRKGE